MVGLRGEDALTEAEIKSRWVKASPFERCERRKESNSRPLRKEDISIEVWHVFTAVGKRKWKWK